MRNKGFTLIELLVVVAIIGLLASVVVSSLNSARVKARDAKRLQDMAQMHTALEMYFNDNGEYPVIGYWVYSNNASWGNLQSALAPYMQELPVDPVNNAITPWVTGNYSYAYGYNPVSNPAADSYDLVTQLENQSSNLTCEERQWRIHFDPILYPTWCGNYSPYIYTGK